MKVEFSLFVNPNCSGKHKRSDTTSVSEKNLDGDKRPAMIAMISFLYISSNKTGFVTPPQIRLLHSKKVPDVRIKFSAGTVTANKCPQAVIPHPSVIKFKIYANEDDMGCRNQYDIALVENSCI